MAEKQIKEKINNKIKDAKKSIAKIQMIENIKKKVTQYKKDKNKNNNSKKVKKERNKTYIKYMDKLSNIGARIITANDNFQSKVDRRIFIISYFVAKALHEARETFKIKRKSYLTHFAGVILIAIAVGALFDYATAFEYSYNGRVLGYVRNQEDVTKVLSLVSKELSEEYKSKITIEEDRNIAFRNVVSLNRDIDDIDTVLKRLTYMSDMQARAAAIICDGKVEAIVETREIAKDVLETVQAQFLTESSRTKYEKVGFAEDISIKAINTKLANISSIYSAKKKIMTGGVGETVYRVKSGDTVSGICKDFDISQKDLKKMNKKLNVNMIHIGQKILISRAVPSLTVQTTEVSTYAEAVNYKTKYKKTKKLYKGETSVSRSGKNGKQVVTARIVRNNGNIVDKEVLEKEVIKKPVSKIVLKGTRKLPPKEGTGSFIVPVSGYTLTSNFGYRWGRLHEGVDLACGTGTTIRASDGGTVSFAGWYYGYGYMVEISHGGGIVTRYGHCNTLDVSSGDKVYQGQKIAEVGNTGNSYGSHCHFEVRKNGSPVDPFNYI
ncbi:MAG: peptidoglycan DD-metalloendopeptidase family protein [Anaerovoracaceae bacterium]